MRRAFGWSFGAATQVFFLFTVQRIWKFLGGHEPSASGGSEWINALLALQFAVPHSALLYPRVKKAFFSWISPAFYGCFFCVATCCSLMVTIAFWQESDVVVVRLDGAAGFVIRGFYLASWGALFYSLSLTGLGYQTGLTPWWDWVRRRPQRRRQFVQHGAYRILRHPIYLSFLGLVWFTPVVTLDRLVLMGVWTPYILIGSWLKDRRLLYFIGEPYRIYMAQVPGYPGFWFGPLARRPFEASDHPSLTIRRSPPPKRDHAPERQRAA